MLIRIGILSCVLFSLLFSTFGAEARKCSGSSENNISCEEFMIDVNTIAPGGSEFIGQTTQETVENVLLTVLEKLIVMFGVVALVFMTLSAGYMIIYNGQDELLTKGKTMFSASLISLVIALLAGLMVRLLIYLLY